MKKNDLVKVQIEDMGVGGEGIGKVDGFTLFIKDAVIGDLVEARIMKIKKNYGYARLIKVCRPSRHRVEPVCPYARKCGGCQLQELSYEKQLEFKENKVRGNLLHIGGVPDELLFRAMEPVVGMKYGFRYRNKAQFPVGVDKEGKLVTGFYAGRTHSIISNTDCAVGVPVNKEIRECILDFMEEYGIRSYNEEQHNGLVRHILIRYGFRTKEIMVCLVINGETLPYSEVLAERLSQIRGMTSITVSVNKEKTNVIMGPQIRPVWGQTYITDFIGDVKYQISPLSFYQVNPVQTEQLYGAALEYAGLTGQETVWDLYCGIGTISLFLARRARQVYGVEIVPQAIQDARENARINGIKNAEFYTGRAEDVLPEYYRRYEEEHPGEKAHADVIVVDPPRKGCDETLLRTMADMRPERIVYVSCDSATMARDVKYLREKGYEVERVRAVDMFPQTVSVETVCLLGKRKPDTTVKIGIDMEDYRRIRDEEKAE